MKLPSFLSGASVLITTAAGAAVASLVATCPDVKTAAAGAAAVFVASLLHLYQPTPGAPKQ